MSLSHPVILPSFRVVSPHVIPTAAISPLIFHLPFRTVKSAYTDIVDDVLAQAPYFHTDVKNASIRLYFPHEKVETDEVLTLYVYEPKTFEHLASLMENAHPFILSRMIGRGAAHFQEALGALMRVEQPYYMPLLYATCPLPVSYTTLATVDALAVKLRYVEHDGQAYLQFTVDHPDTEAAIYALLSPYDCTFHRSHVATKWTNALPAAYAQPFEGAQQYAQTLLDLLQAEIDAEQVIEEIIDYALKPL